MTYQEAEDYAKRIVAGGKAEVMLDRQSGEYHVIVGSFEHWRKRYDVISVVESAPTVKLA